MEIHGSDTIIKSNIPIADNLIRLLVQDHWPLMVYEIMTCQDGTVDLILYKNEDAKKAWDRDGWSDTNDVTMIYIIFSNGAKEISITIDDKGENSSIVKDIEQFIRNIDGNTKQI